MIAPSRAPEHRANRLGDPVAIVADRVRGADVDADLRQPPRDECACSYRRAARAAARCRPRRAQRSPSAFEPRGISKANVRGEAVGGLDHRGTPHVRALPARGCACAHRLALCASRSTNRVKRSSIARCNAFFSALPDPRRETGGRNRDAHGTGLRDRGHRDEAVARLIDAAQQKALAIGELAQARRERRVLRRRDDEERIRQIVGRARALRIGDAAHVGARFEQRRRLLRSPRGSSFAPITTHNRPSKFKLTG